MAKKFMSLNQEHIDFIKKQKVFFVATAMETGHINISPKGYDSFRILNPNLIAWLNYTGSGNETAAHLEKNSRMTVMFTSFDKEPMTLRLYGQARSIHEWDYDWNIFAPQFPDIHGARQFIELDIEFLQTSCGYSTPLYEFKGERDDLKKWLVNKSDEEIKKYWAERNMISLDGDQTGMENMK